MLPWAAARCKRHPHGNNCKGYTLEGKVRAQDAPRPAEPQGEARSLAGRTSDSRAGSFVNAATEPGEGAASGRDVPRRAAIGIIGSLIGQSTVAQSTRFEVGDDTGTLSGSPMDLDQTQLQDREQRARSQSLSAQQRRPPLQVAGYVMESFLGEGAFGEVWVAIKKNTGQRVAIKFCTRRRAEDWSLLVREVEKLAQLSTDTYVVKLLDTDPSSDPPFFIMEYLERGSLEQEIQQNGTLPVEQALSIFRETCIGLAHSHGKGILHCDLKPANVLLDQDSRPRICDFGQSRLTSEQQPALGTLFYMAPEQASLEAVPDVRWDVYALGAIFYCMLVGRPPYRTDANVDALQAAPGLAERLRSYREIIGNSPKPTEHRNVPGVDRYLAEIIDRCLATKPEKRYQNVQVVLNELEARNRRLARRPLYVLGALGPVLLLGVVALFTGMGFRQSVAESQNAVVERALESKSQSAWAYAEIVSRELQSRWDALEAELKSPQLLGLVKEHQDIAGLDGPENELETWLSQARSRHAHLSSSSWFITDRAGVQLARDPPHAGTFGRNFNYRDYFHGQGWDLPNTTRGMEPIKEPYLSSVFTSRSTQRRMVAFSVPIADPESGEVWGVMAMTVELGLFTEVQRSEQPDDQMAVLVDCRTDSGDDGQQGQAGSVLEHRCFRHQQIPPQLYLDADTTEIIKTLCREGNVTTSITTDSYRDPVVDGQWLAAVEAVMIKTPNNGRKPTGWAVIVQEPLEKVRGPIVRLRDTLMMYGLVMLGVSLLVIALLWGLVRLTESGRPQSRFLRYIRRRLGLATATGTPSGGTATATNTSSAHGSTAPPSATD